MDEHGILVADKDTRFLKRMADFFSAAGYQVETTDSAVHVICTILRKQTPVLLVGSDLDTGIDVVQLLNVLKKCNRHLAVIFVSDEVSMPLLRRVRQEGVFYHALRPVASADQEELGEAVKEALEVH